MDLDDLLSGNSHKRTGSMAAKQVDIFEFDNVQPGGQAQNQQQQPANNSADPFANLSSANVALSSAPNQQQTQKPVSGFVPNPMSHKQEQAQMMMQQQQQQMMAMMAQQQ